MKQFAGFTLIEILVAVTIVAVLSAIGVTSYQSINKRSRDAARKSNLEQVRVALEMYRSSNGVYPDVPVGYEALSALDPGDGTGPLVPDYLPSIPTDPKSTASVIIPYYYYSPPGNYSYCLCGQVENAGDAKNDCGRPLRPTGCNYGVGNP